MKITQKDLSLLREGEPPESDELLSEMTIGKEKWIEIMKEYYLENYINNGGSKVKMLISKRGTGKTHLLKYLNYTAKNLDYNSMYFSIREITERINNISDFYKLIAKKIDPEILIRGLSLKVAEQMGFSQEKYDGTTKLLPLLIESGFGQFDAKREIKQSVYNAFKNADFSPSFFTFAYLVVNERLCSDNIEHTKIAIKWLKGEKLERSEKRDTYLFEILQKSNARYWLNALIKILNFAGIKGIVVLLDDLEVLTEKNIEGKYIYTLNAVKDTYELLRQLIDDMELLNGFLLVLAGDKILIDDEKRGLKSYEALWMRLQTGLVQVERFNPLADIVDVDLHLKSCGDNFPELVRKKVIEIFQTSGFKLDGSIQVPDLSKHSSLRSAVMETALRVNNPEDN